MVRVSADNRFILYVNGTRVGDGPARGDLGHWRYERFDLAPLLKPGENLITATVWNWGVYAPVAQMSDRTAFPAGKRGHRRRISISTPEGWMVEEEPGHRPLDRSSVTLQEYFASGPGEEIDAAKYDWSVEFAGGAQGSGWVPAGHSHARQHLSRREQGALRRYHRRQLLGAGARTTCRTWSIRAPVPGEVVRADRTATGPARLSRRARSP